MVPKEDKRMNSKMITYIVTFFIVSFMGQFIFTLMDNQGWLVQHPFRANTAKGFALITRPILGAFIMFEIQNALRENLGFKNAAKKILDLVYKKLIRILLLTMLAIMICIYIRN